MKKSTYEEKNRNSSYRIAILDKEGREIDYSAIDQEDIKNSIKNFYEEQGLNLPYFRRRLPTTRRSLTHKFDIVGHEGYLIVGFYEDGRPGELFITMAKEGSTLGGMMDAYGTAISLCLQSGIPLKDLAKKFLHSRFEPNGYTNNPEIPIANSIVDYIFRWLGKKFLTEEEQKEVGILNGGLEEKLEELTKKK